MHFVNDVVALPAVKGYQVADVGLHGPAARQHEVEDEQQHHDVDGEIDDAAQHVLPHPGEHGDERGHVALLPQVVAGPFVEQRREVFHGVEQLLGVGREVLDVDHQHPADQREGDQKAEDGLDQQQRSGGTRPPAPPFGQKDHLAAQQHVEGCRPHQSAQKGGQFDEDGRAESENQHEKRIAPVSLTKISHTPPHGQGACRKRRRCGSISSGRHSARPVSARADSVRCGTVSSIPARDLPRQP